MVTKETSLLRNSRCAVIVQEGTLAVPVYSRSRLVGYVFHGSGTFTLDTIIETRQGALGKPTVKDLNQPFLMLAGKDSKECSSISLLPAASDNIAKAGYNSAEEYIQAAFNLCKRLLDHGGKVDFESASRNGIILALPQNKEFDLLSSSGEKVVYVTKGKVYVFNQDEQVLTGSGGIIVSKRGRLVSIKDGQILIEK